MSSNNEKIVNACGKGHEGNEQETLPGRTGEYEHLSLDSKGSRPLRASRATPLSLPSGHSGSAQGPDELCGLGCREGDGEITFCERGMGVAGVTAVVME